MPSQPELIAPITVDLRAPDNRMDIIKGMEHINVKDELLDASLVATDLELGDWLVKGASNTMVAPTGTPVANTYPLWVGDDQFDANATGQVTLIVGGHFIYRTTKYAAGSYTNGQNLTVKSGTVPIAATGTDPILARVYTAPDSKGVMEIEVLNR